MRVPHKAMVVVTDGRKRLFFRNDGDALAPDLTVVTAAEDANPRTGRQVTDSLHRASSIVAGSGTLSGADAHEVEEERFASETADELNRAALAGAFEDLVLIAPPKTLGRVRKTLHHETEKRLLRTIPKDVTGHPIGEIERMLASLD